MLSARRACASRIWLPERLRKFDGDLGQVDGQGIRFSFDGTCEAVVIGMQRSFPSDIPPQQPNLACPYRLFWTSSPGSAKKKEARREPPTIHLFVLALRESLLPRTISRRHLTCGGSFLPCVSANCSMVLER